MEYNFLNDKSELIYKTEIDSQTQNILMFTKEKKQGGKN